MAQIVVRIPEDLAEWLEAEHSGRGDVSRLVRRLLENERDAAIPNGFVPSPLAEPVRNTSKKAKACAHSETIFKMGARYCVKCGEFV